MGGMVGNADLHCAIRRGIRIDWGGMKKVLDTCRDAGWLGAGDVRTEMCRLEFFGVMYAHYLHFVVIHEGIVCTFPEVLRVVVYLRAYSASLYAACGPNKYRINSYYTYSSLLIHMLLFHRITPDYCDNGSFSLNGTQ